MNKQIKRIGILPLLAVALVAVGGVVAAVAHRRGAGVEAGRPEVKVTLSGSVEREGAAVALDKAGNVKPGEVLNWQINSVNEGTGAAREYKAVGNIPEGTTLVAGTAAGEHGSTVTYSIDGGKTYSTQPIIEQRQPDGTTKRVPAPVSMYTQVRYEWNDDLAAGGKLSASYQVRVK